MERSYHFPEVSEDRPLCSFLISLTNVTLSATQEILVTSIITLSDSFQSHSNQLDMAVAKCKSNRFE